MTEHLEREKKAFLEFFKSGQNFMGREGRVSEEPNDAERSGLDGIIYSTFPIQDFHESVTLEYVMYDIRIYSAEKDIEAQKENDDGRWLSELDDETEFFMEIPKPADIPEGFSSFCNLVVTLQLAIWETDDQTGSRSISGINEQPVSIGWLPQMTVNGTFFHGGVEKKYSGEGLAVDSLGRFLQIAFLEVEKSIITTLAHIEGKTANPFDLVDPAGGALKARVGEFLDSDQLVPISDG